MLECAYQQIKNPRIKSERMANGSGAGAELDRNWLDNLSDEELVDTFARSKNDRRAAHRVEAIIARYWRSVTSRNSRYRFPAWIRQMTGPRELSSKCIEGWRSGGGREARFVAASRPAR
jgi:hypothetical protein